MADMAESGTFTVVCFGAGKLMFSSTKTTPQMATYAMRITAGTITVLKHHSNYNR
ncbi:hypothetical protein BACFIN_05788 [Bacteroides finegoldii DSM 17565]|nr:hypothetical protein BACFIN_05788 [Bacteroides finegoldii DSM 17565]